MHLAQCRDVAFVLRVGSNSFLGNRQLGADGAGQIGIRGFPQLGARVAVYRGPEFRQRGLRVPFEQLGQMVEIDAADRAQCHGERVGRTGYQRRGGRGDHPFAKHRPHAGEAGFKIKILDAGDQPAIGVVGERGEVRAAVRLPLLAGLRVGRGGDDGVVDRPEITDERRIGDAQLDLVRRPGGVGGLRAQHVAHRVADRQQGADDFGGFLRNSVAALAVLDRHRLGRAADDLHQAAGLADEVGALLDRGPVSRGAGANDRLVVGLGRGPCRRLEDACGEKRQRFVQQRLQRAVPGPGPAGVGQARTIDAAPQRVGAQHHLGMGHEIRVDAVCLRRRRGGVRRNGGLVVAIRGVRPVHLDFAQPGPGLTSRRLDLATALEHQHVDHDVRAGGRAHAGLG